MTGMQAARRNPDRWGSNPWWGWLLCLLVWSGPGVAEVHTLTQAQATVVLEGVRVRQGVVLPYHWDRANPGQRGEAIFDFAFELPHIPDDVWGIYLPGLGNAYQIWLNGTLVQRFGTVASPPGDVGDFNGTDSSRVPRYVSVDSGHLQRTNQLRIHIRADVGRRGGLAPPVIGPQDAVYPLYVQAYRWRATGSVGVVAFCLVVGLTALVLWSSHTGWRQAGRVGRDPLYLFAAVAQLGWAVYVGDVLVEDPPLRWPWWGMLQSLALGIWGSSMVLACMELADWREQAWVPRFRRWLLVLLVLCPGCAWWSLGGGQPLALTAWYGTLGLSVLGFVVAFLWSALRQARVEQRMVALVALVNIVVALRDFYVFRIDPVYAANTWVRYSSVLFGLAMGAVVLSRFRATHAQLQDLLGTLAQRVSDKEQALRESYVRLEALARQQERTAERSRILRNMHDGVGAHISSAMRQLQGQAHGGGGGGDEVLLTLRDAMDQLKLSIDAIHLVPGDVTALLANLRYRLGPRFRAMGIDLHWDVDLLPLCPALDAGAMSELQFMLFEALSNVLQHANARTLRIEAHVQDDNRVFVRVVDDGCGFDLRSKGKRGMASLRERAAAIGAQLRIASQSGQTVVEIQLQA
jgi:signal transduction histidine kinase